MNGATLDDFFVFGLFLIVSNCIALQIFRFTTYRKHFLYALPILVCYSALAGYVLFVLEIHFFFVWQLVLTAWWLYHAGSNQAQAARALRRQLNWTLEERNEILKSTNSTMLLYIISSTIYMAVFSLSYLLAYNA